MGLGLGVGSHTGLAGVQPFQLSALLCSLVFSFFNSLFLNNKKANLILPSHVYTQEKTKKILGLILPVFILLHRNIKLMD